MSNYTNYDDTSSGYNEGRRPAGADVIAALLQIHSSKPLSELHVLDAGCGTGNYSKALLDYRVGRLSMFDASNGMLEFAREKLTTCGYINNVVEMKQGKLPRIPFEDSTFDAIMFNMVLHHLELKAGNGSFPNTVAALKESNRVLKKGGVLFISTSLPQQYNEAVWYAQLNPDITEKMAARYLPLSTWKALISDAGFEFNNALSVLGSDWFAQYHDVEGPLSKSWRDNDSYWSLATEAELQYVEDKMQAMKKAGSLQKFKEEHDRSQYIGHLVIISALKK